MASASDLGEEAGEMACGVQTCRRDRADVAPTAPPALSFRLIRHALYGPVMVPELGAAGGSKAIREAPGSLRTA